MNPGTYRLAELYCEPLQDEIYFAFNPQRTPGLMLFSGDTLRLLEVFRQPISLAEGAARVDDSPEALAMAVQLAQFGLLVPQDENELPRMSRSYTLTVWLHVTEDCNLRCEYCYLDKQPRVMDAATGLAAIHAIFRSAIQHGFRQVKIKYAGGEPTLRFDQVIDWHTEARRLADENHILLSGVVLSNGIGLTESKIQALVRSQLRLMISLDGIGAVHDRQRHFANHAASFPSILKSLDLLDRMGFQPTLSVTLTRQNLAGLPDLLAFILDRHYPFSLNFYRENDLSQPNLSLALAADELVAGLEQAYAVIERQLPGYSLLNSLLDRTRLDMPHSYACGVGQSYLVIGTDGQVAKCHMDFAHPVSSIHLTDPLGELRAADDGVDNVPVEEKVTCRVCLWRTVCAGGCPLLTRRLTGNSAGPSPFCQVYKRLLPRVLRLEALRLLRANPLIA